MLRKQILGYFIRASAFFFVNPVKNAFKGSNLQIKSKWRSSPRMPLSLKFGAHSVSEAVNLRRWKAQKRKLDKIYGCKGEKCDI